MTPFHVSQIKKKDLDRCKTKLNKLIMSLSRQHTWISKPKLISVT